jgi:predicted LPLAT superfamily acyltransferase
MTLFAHFLLLLLNILKYLPVRMLQAMIFLLTLPLVLSSLLFKNLIFFQRAQKNYLIACQAYQQKPKKFFLFQHAWGLAYAFAQLPATWLKPEVKINTTHAQNLIKHLERDEKGTLIIAAHLASFEMIPRAILKILEQHPDKKIYTLYILLGECLLLRLLLILVKQTRLANIDKLHNGFPICECNLLDCCSIRVENLFYINITFYEI